ncbi:MAG: hypothetical protein ACK58L_00260 [Planctomycetota bacterium]
MRDGIVPAAFLFHFALPIKRNEAVPLRKGGLLQLNESAQIFVPSSLNEGQAKFDLRGVWNERGIGFQVEIRGRTLPVCGTRKDLKASDSIRIFLDLRHTANVHRATEYCTAILVLPIDEDADDRPSVSFTEIAQQRTVRKDRDDRKCLVNTTLFDNGYRCELWIPGSQLAGFEELPNIGHLGFSCQILDSEFGELPLSVGGDFPTGFDPSTWLQLQLVS